MALTANRELNRYVDQELRSFPVAAATHIWKGALVGIDRATGHVRGLAAGDTFAGIAYEEMDNTNGDGAAKNIRLYTQGDFVLTVNGATAVWTGASVYALSDEVTGLLTTGGASYCGVLLAAVGTNLGIVRIQPLAASQIEHAVSTPLASSTSAATTNPVMITQRAIKIASIEVSFNTVPNSGDLDVGTHATNPIELVNSFDLTSLTPNVPAAVTPSSRDVAKGLRIWAKVAQASSSAGVGGLLTIRYCELP